jgi:hypothetical protein
VLQYIYVFPVKSLHAFSPSAETWKDSIHISDVGFQLLKALVSILPLSAVILNVFPRMHQKLVHDVVVIFMPIEYGQQPTQSSLLRPLQILLQCTIHILASIRKTLPLEIVEASRLLNRRKVGRWGGSGA